MISLFNKTKQNLFYYCHEIRNCPILLAFEIEIPVIIEFPFYFQSLPHFKSLISLLKFFDLNWDEIETIETAIITTTTRHMKAQQIL